MSEYWDQNRARNDASMHMAAELAQLAIIEHDALLDCGMQPNHGLDGLLSAYVNKTFHGQGLCPHNNSRLFVEASDAAKSAVRKTIEDYIRSSN